MCSFRFPREFLVSSSQCRVHSELNSTSVKRFKIIISLYLTRSVRRASDKICTPIRYELYTYIPYETFLICVTSDILLVPQRGDWKPKVFIRNLRLVSTTGNPTAGSSFAERISLAIQRRIAANVLGTILLDTILRDIMGLAYSFIYKLWLVYLHFF